VLIAEHTETSSTTLGTIDDISPNDTSEIITKPKLDEENVIVAIAPSNTNETQEKNIPSSDGPQDGMNPGKSLGNETNNELKNETQVCKTPSVSSTKFIRNRKNSIIITIRGRKARFNKRVWLRRLIILLVCIIIIVIITQVWNLVLPPVINFINSIKLYTGAWGGFIIFLFIVLFGFPFIQGYFIFVASASVLYGVGWGLLISFFGSNFSAIFGLLISRRFLKSWVVKKLKLRPEDESTGDDDEEKQEEDDEVKDIGITIPMIVKALELQAWKIVFLLRLTPLSNSVQNAVYGVSDISILNHTTATFLGTIPDNIALSVIGGSLGNLQDYASNGEKSPTEYIVLAVELTLAVIMFAVVGWRVKLEITKIKAGLQEEIREKAEINKSKSNAVLE